MDKGSPGLGYYGRSQHENLLIAKRGHPMVPQPGDRFSTMIYAPRRAHSQKPDEVYERLEQAYPDMPKLELFARTARPGWATFGNEALRQTPAA